MNKFLKNRQLYHFLDAGKSKERQASKKFYEKCSENSRYQIVFRTDIFRKLSLGAPEYLFDVVGLTRLLIIVGQKCRRCYSGNLVSSVSKKLNK